MYNLQVQAAGYDFHPDREIKSSSLLKMMQLAATIDAENNGMGYDDLLQDGLAFVAYKTVLEIGEPMKELAPLNIKTWNRPKRGVRYVRDYIVTSGDAVVAKSTSEWAMMNFEKRTLAKNSEIKRSMAEIDESVGLDVFMRIDYDVSTLCYEGEQKLRYSDLDINGHLNNTVYLDICEDVSPFDFEKYRVKTVWIVYKREIKIDMLMDIKVYKNESDFITEVHDKDTGELLFQVRIFVEEKR
jgi:acyl-ACP thioesterase